ncbi:MAG: hypothetical protein K9M99_09720 [Candidatus Cloacimonetes bacterium]|nr:hypothetical protein [Candidatus Cloacimonadota bacterium]
MYLKKMTLLALIGFSYFFVMRLIGTFFPEINYNFTWLKIELIINFFAHIAIVLFFVFLLKDYIPDDEITLMNITVLTFMGTLTLLIVNTLNGLSSLMGISLDHSLTGRYLVNMIIWIVGFIIVIFFLYLSQHLCKKSQAGLCNAALLAFAGTIVAFILRSINMLNYYFHSNTGRIFLDLKQNALIIPGVILVLFSYFSLILFIVKFYRSLLKKKNRII